MSTDLSTSNDSSIMLLTAPRSSPSVVGAVLRFKTYEDAVKFIQDNTVEVDGQLRYSVESKLADYIHPSELSEGQTPLVLAGSLEEWMRNAMEAYKTQVLSVPFSLEDQAPFEYLGKIDHNDE
jgi:hypothetical protein